MCMRLILIITTTLLLLIHTTTTTTTIPQIHYNNIHNASTNTSFLTLDTRAQQPPSMQQPPHTDAGAAEEAARALGVEESSETESPSSAPQAWLSTASSTQGFERSQHFTSVAAGLPAPEPSAGVSPALAARTPVGSQQLQPLESELYPSPGEGAGGVEKQEAAMQGVATSMAASSAPSSDGLVLPAAASAAALPPAAGTHSALPQSAPAQLSCSTDGRGSGPEAPEAAVLSEHPGGGTMEESAGDSGGWGQGERKREDETQAGSVDAQIAALEAQIADLEHERVASGSINVQMMREKFEVLSHRSTGE